MSDKETDGQVGTSSSDVRKAQLWFSSASYFVLLNFPIPWVIKFLLTTQGLQSGAFLGLPFPVIHSVHTLYAR